MKNIIKITGLSFALLSLFGLIGCDNISASGALESEHRTFTADGIGSAQVKISLQNSSLELAGGSSDLFETELFFADPKDEPAVDYKTDGGKATITVSQPSQGIFKPREEPLTVARLSKSVPVDLDLELGEGAGSIKLANSYPREVIVKKMGGGKVTVDLGQEWDHSFNVTINGDYAPVELIVPAGVSTVVAVEGGVSEVINTAGLRRMGNLYVNEAYGASPVTVNVKIGSNHGLVKFESPAVVES